MPFCVNDVSFTARQGEITALVGPSGCGKSTLSKLAARFWDVDCGRILIGGRDIGSIEPETLLSYFSIVFQDVVLFNDTIYNNIKIGKKDATRAEIMAAARTARCEEFIQKLPQGYDTVIGENGKTLSGGERQRLSGRGHRFPGPGKRDSDPGGHRQADPGQDRADHRPPPAFGGKL